MDETPSVCFKSFLKTILFQTLIAKCCTDPPHTCPNHIGHRLDPCKSPDDSVRDLELIIIAFLYQPNQVIYHVDAAGYNSLSSSPSFSLGSDMLADLLHLFSASPFMLWEWAAAVAGSFVLLFMNCSRRLSGDGNPCLHSNNSFIIKSKLPYDVSS